MSETIKCELFPPHPKTAEGSKRFEAAVEQRNQADYACFLALRELEDEGILTKSRLAEAMTGVKLSRLEGDDKEAVIELADQVQEALKKRRDADMEFSNALLNRP